MDPIAESIPRYHDYGARFFFSQAVQDFATNGVDYYLASRLLWDESLDPKAVLADFYQTAFGEAAGPMRAYHDELAAAWKRVQGDPDLEGQWAPQRVLPMFDAETLARCRAQLSRAESLATDEGSRSRVEFIGQGFQWTEAHVRAESTLRDVERAGIDVRKEEEPPAGLSRPELAKRLDLLQRARDAWETRAELLQRFDKSFVIASWKVRNRWDERYDVLPQLRSLARKYAERSRASGGGS